MKKYFWLIFVLLCCVFIVVLVYFNINRLNMKSVNEAEVRFVYGDINESHCLDKKEVALLKNIFDGKKMYKDNLSCGFSDDISIRFNNEQTFCIACDTCPIIFIKEENKYIKLSEIEKMELYDLLESYGFFFPCL